LESIRNELQIILHVQLNTEKEVCLIYLDRWKSTVPKLIQNFGPKKKKRYKIVLGNDILMVAEQIIGHIRGDKVNGDCLVLSVGPRHALYATSVDMSLSTTCTATCMTPAYS
jgi:hypothetical protein